MADEPSSDSPDPDVDVNTKRRRKSGEKPDDSVQESGDVQPLEALDQIYQKNSRELWAIFYSQCSDPERAYDAVQEAFLRLHAYNGEPIRDARAWLLRVGQNWLRDVARRKSSSCKLSASLDELVQDRISPQEFLVGDENRSVIREALQQLLEDDRKVLVMKYSLNWSAAQMATAMDCSAPAIDMRLSRARRRLAELLEEQGYHHD
ncbi:MAG: sigma-70 family RNA polymerase sigma factor [Planctomycetaceae bacterium]